MDRLSVAECRSVPLLLLDAAVVVVGGRCGVCVLCVLCVCLQCVSLSLLGQYRRTRSLCCSTLNS